MAVKNLQQLTVPPFAPSANSSKLDQHILNDPSRITTIGDIIPKNSKIGETSHDFVESIPVSSIKENSTDRGQLLGIVRPAWRKVLESEMREFGTHD